MYLFEDIAEYVDWSGTKSSIVDLVDSESESRLSSGRKQRRSISVRDRYEAIDDGLLHVNLTSLLFEAAVS